MLEIQGMPPWSLSGKCLRDEGEQGNKVTGAQGEGRSDTQIGIHTDWGEIIAWKRITIWVFPCIVTRKKM